MPELSADGPVPEMTEEGASKAYANLRPTFGEYAGKVIGETSEMLYGALNRATYDESGWGKLGRAIGAAGMAEAGASPETYGITPDLAPVPSPHLSKEEANKRHPDIARDAPELFADNMPEGVVDALADSKRQELEREGVFQRFEQAHSWPVNFAARTALTLLDPVNTAALFIPGVGEEAVLARLGSGVAARMGARAVAGGTAGIAGMVPGVAARLGLSEADGGDYGLRQAFGDLASGAVMGALIHAGIGGAREAGLLKPDALMRGADVRRDATSAAVAEVLDGRQVNVNPVTDAPQALDEVAQQQRDMHEAGSIPSMPQSELAAATDELYGAHPVSEVKAESGKPAMNAAEGEATPIQAAVPKELAAELTNLTQRVAEQEQIAQGLPLVEEDRAQISATRTEAANADMVDRIYATAADCLKIF